MVLDDPGREVIARQDEAARLLAPRMSIVFRSKFSPTNPREIEIVSVPLGTGESTRHVSGSITWAIRRNCPAAGPVRSETTSPAAAAFPWG